LCYSVYRSPTLKASFLEISLPKALDSEQGDEVIDIFAGYFLSFHDKLVSAMSKLVEGEVEYICDPNDRPEPGCVLICCSKPKTHAVVDV